MNQPDQGAAWRLTDMHHVGLTVSDIERSIVFYRDVLGMTLVRRRPKVDADYVGQQTGYSGVALSVASFQVSQESKQTLEVVQYLNQGGPPIEPATNRAGSSHLCLLVSDFHVCHADLAAKGAAFKSEPVTITEGPNEGGVVIYLSDPDGYTIELFQPPARESE